MIEWHITNQDAGTFYVILKNKIIFPFTTIKNKMY